MFLVTVGTWHVAFTTQNTWAVNLYKERFIKLFSYRLLSYAPCPDGLLSKLHGAVWALSSVLQNAAEHSCHCHLTGFHGGQDLRWTPKVTGGHHLEASFLTMWDGCWLFLCLGTHNLILWAGTVGSQSRCRVIPSVNSYLISLENRRWLFLLIRVYWPLDSWMCNTVILQWQEGLEVTQP